MTEPTTNVRTRLFVGLVALAGALAGGSMLVESSQPAGGDRLLLLVFGLLGVSWSLLTFGLGAKPSGSASVALPPAAFQALFPLAGRQVVAAVTALVSLTDWALNRRGWLPGVFNLGQYLIAACAATHVAHTVSRALGGLTGVGLGALAGGLVFSLLSVALISAVIHLATQKTARESGVITFSTVTNETILSCFSALLAVFWQIHPLMLIVPVVPLTLLFLLLARLERRETDLERQQNDLRAIQDLGLEVSARLDVKELGPVVTRIVADDLRARGALLAFLDDNSPSFRVAAFFDRAAHADQRPPAVLARLGLDDAFLAQRQPLIGGATSPAGQPELTAYGMRTFIAQPLTILGRPEGVLIVFDDGRRSPFGADDAERLIGLERFIEVALNNARLYDDLRRIQQQLVQSAKMSALGELISGVAHELNNPLATIMGTAELFSGKELPNDVEGMVARIQREAQRAARIVRNLLAFSRQHRPDLSWHDLNAIILEAVELCGERCRRHNIALTTELDPGLPSIQIDPHQMQQVLLNLVANAEQAIVGAERPAGRIAIRTTRDARRVRFEVSDDGPGIREEDLDKIFNPFFTTKDVGQGTGLGLPICYGLVQEHGGTIRVRPNSDGGVTFLVELPAVIAPAVHVDRTPAVHADDAPPASLAGGRALVVDDDEGVRTVLAEALSAWGFTVERAESGAAGLDRLRSGAAFDVALVDLRMPGLGGEGLYERARAEGLQLPALIFSTGDVVHPAARQFLDRTGIPVLLKPFTLRTLRDAVQQALATPRAAAPV